MSCARLSSDVAMAVLASFWEDVTVVVRAVDHDQNLPTTNCAGGCALVGHLTQFRCAQLGTCGIDISTTVGLVAAIRAKIAAHHA
jgi:hypothetical protein